MKQFILSCLIFCQLHFVYAQNWTWAETAGGILPDEANGCTMDSSGNMYVSGFFFSSSINFNNGNSLSNSGICEGFIVKYNTLGKSVWASRIKGSAEDKATGCAVDKSGNVIVTGYFDSPTLHFGGNNAHSVTNSKGNNGTFDAFVVKYNASGTPLWFHAIGKDDDDGGRSVTTDSVGNVYVTGWFRAPSIVVGSITLYNNNPAGGSSDVFLIKYDPNGNVLWAKSAGGPDDDKGNSCVVDPSGNVIITGYFKPDSINFEGSKFANKGSKDFFVAKYRSDGTLLAVKTFGGSGGEEAFECSVDGAGNVFISGNFSSSKVMFDADSIVNTGSSSGAFLIKLNSALYTLWTKGASSNANDEARGCSTDKYGNTVITGVFNGSSITFGNTMLNNNGGEEIFLVKYAPGGNQLWAKKMGKSKSDGANGCFLHHSGKILVAGYYNSSSLTLGNIDLDNSYTGIATSDVFVASTCNAQTGADNQTSCSAYTWIDGNTYTASNNTATHTKAGVGNACDSFITLNLIVLNKVENTINESICAGKTYTFKGQQLTQDGQYFDTLQTTLNCDSFIVLNFTVDSFVTSSISQSICQGLTYTFNGQALTQEGQYLDTLTSSGGCDSIVTLTLVVNDLPQPSITQNGNVLSTQTFDTYQWQLGGGDISNDTAQSHTAVANGNYTVLVTDSNGCSAFSPVLNVTGVVISEILDFRSVIYPNSTENILNIEISSHLSTPTSQFQIIDMQGRIVMTSTFEEKTALDVSRLAATTYQVIISNGNSTSVKRFVKL